MQNSVPPSLLSIANNPDLDPLVQAAKKGSMLILEQNEETVTVEYARDLLTPSCNVTKEQWANWAQHAQIQSFERPFGPHVIVMDAEMIKLMGGIQADETEDAFLIRVFGDPNESMTDVDITEDQWMHRKIYSLRTIAREAKLMADWIPPRFAPLARMHADERQKDPIAFQSLASSKSRRNHFSEAQQLEDAKLAFDPYRPDRSPAPVPHERRKCLDGSMEITQ